jgi:hypothetical protein
VLDAVAEDDVVDAAAGVGVITVVVDDDDDDDVVGLDGKAPDDPADAAAVAAADALSSALRSNPPPWASDPLVAGDDAEGASVGVSSAGVVTGPGTCVPAAEEVDEATVPTLLTGAVETTDVASMLARLALRTRLCAALRRRSRRRRMSSMSTPALISRISRTTSRSPQVASGLMYISYTMMVEVLLVYCFFLPAGAMSGDTDIRRKEEKKKKKK